ncbi:SIR2 family protein, partial [Blautia wexlerae]
NIITTNFDPLIDKILENIPHRKIVGELTSELGDNPKITFIKAHGDLKYGNLRFSPFELQKLPAELENKIRQLTKGIVIVVGYRGQDIGIMNSLNTSDDHCAFWVSPTKPEIYDGYTNDPIYDWMKKRNSEGNFIYGE